MDPCIDIYILTGYIYFFYIQVVTAICYCKILLMSKCTWLVIVVRLVKISVVLMCVINRGETGAEVSVSAYWFYFSTNIRFWKFSVQIIKVLEFFYY